MSISVIICNGCCCGRVEKGHNEVPIDELEAAWEANRIGEAVKLTISDCLGPCSMHNEARRFVRVGESIVRLRDLG